MFHSKFTPAALLANGLDDPDALAAARADLMRQALAACALGSPFVRDVLTAAARQLPRAPLLALWAWRAQTGEGGGRDRGGACVSPKSADVTFCADRGMLSKHPPLVVFVWNV